MENRDKNIFRPPAKIMIPDNMRDKSRYSAHHEDFGHLMNDYRNLYGQIMFTIKKGGLQQYVKKDGGTPRMAEQPGPNAMQKGKVVVEQQLRMVLMIVGPAIANAEEEKKSRQEKRTEERVKLLRAWGHLVNYVSAQEEFYPAAPIAFTEQDLYTVRLPHHDPLVIKLQVNQAILGRVLVDGGSSAEVLFWDVFQKMGLDEEMLVPVESPLVVFNGTRVFLKGIT